MSTSSRPLERPAAISVLALIHFVLAAFALLAVAALVLYASSEKRLPVVFALGPQPSPWRRSCADSACGR
ncbi:MAG: hypothetical protein HC882_06470 [Acidobacteria bacterium]|nr:hypothetical protein [Acidobacteriota bacterium]